MKKKLLTLLALTALLISCKRYDLVGVEKFEDDSFLRAVTINLPKGEKFIDFKPDNRLLITSDTLGDINIYSFGGRSLILDYKIKQQ
jgi:hypothetical protein